MRAILAFIVAAAGAMSSAAERKPYVITAGEEWTPIVHHRDIESGSALDFSCMGFVDAPAGKHGWLKNVAGHFEFENLPGVRKRFYGVNLVGTANFPDHALADALVERFTRTGYNAIRIHHYDVSAVDGAADGVTLNALSMDRLDYFIAASIRSGLYITTDLYDSRLVKWRQIGVDRDGTVDMQLFKVLCAIYEPAFENWKAFATNFLLHENKYTGRRYIDEPALPFFALINEGSVFNAWDRGMREDPRVIAAWEKWISEKRASNPSFAQGLDGDRLPERFYERGKNNYPVVAMWCGDLEKRLFARMKSHLRSIGCRALFTNDNNGNHSAALLLASAEYDYVDNHIYVDHPNFIAERWKLPSECKNENPLLAGVSSRLEDRAFARMLGKPFTVTEWNFATPGRFRGVGSTLVGSMASLQDWDGLWRFAYSHTRVGLEDLDVFGLTYFDLARDPLMQASERAAICLFLRGDIAPLSGGIALHLSTDSGTKGRALNAAPEWRDAAWNIRVGTGLSPDEEDGMCVMRREDAETPLARTIVENAKSQTALRIDRKHGTFTIDTPCTCGGFVAEGEINAGALRACVLRAPATVMLHSLDGEPIHRSRRLLLTHLTDVQGDGATFADESMKVLLKWGGQPLVRSGAAKISLSIDEPSNYVVYELATSGRRAREIPSQVVNGELRFSVSISGPDGARMLYEVAQKPENAFDRLKRGFLDPPHGNLPQTWWWFESSAPEAAITRDLEGMKRVGISGFHIYGGSPSNKMWIPKVKWALHEAHRLGLDGVVCIGAAGCGHPQTEHRHAQKVLTFSSKTFRRGSRIVIPKKGVAETPKNEKGEPNDYWDIAVFAVPDTTNEIPVAAVRDVTSHFNRETGVFTWSDAPDGQWRIVRIGFVPKVFGHSGCYIDHMSRAAFDAHWARVMTPLLEALSPDERMALKGILCDSYEAGAVSWTETFASEFLRRRGYDLMPWLMVKAGVRIESAPRRARFQRDFAVTIDELIAENHYAYQKEVANRHGLVAISEAAGPHQHQGDVRRMQSRCDVAMGEFWMPCAHRSLPPQRFMVRDSASAAHVYGMGEVLAEAFTTIDTYWIESPRTMKPCVDRAFCDGLTRVCYHGMKLSPSLTDRPGFIRKVGTHYNPQTTWFEQSSAFNRYLGRCSWMLSQGRFVADCLVYVGDAVGVFAGLKTPEDGLGYGYDYDFCPTEVLLQAKAQNGEIVLPSGMRYRVLLLSGKSRKTNCNMMPGLKEAVAKFPIEPLSMGLPAMLKIQELSREGVLVVGERPHGPVGMKESSELFHRAVESLWGRSGVVVPNVSAARNFLANKDIGPDFMADRESSAQDGCALGVDWIHRTKDGGIDIYFLSNQKNEPIAFTALFRQPAGRFVELWNPVSGTCATVGNSPRMKLSLPPSGSLFVVFSDNDETLTQRRDSHGISQNGGGAANIISRGWAVRFDPAFGGPEDTIVLDALIDWTKHPEESIRHYSGMAIYHTTFDAPKDWRDGDCVSIDLGEVREVAEVRVNGEDLGILWTSPFRVNVKNLKATDNVLEVRITNLWPNRLIGDSGLPKDKRISHTNINPYKHSDPLLSSGLLGPVTVNLTMSHR